MLKKSPQGNVAKKILKKIAYFFIGIVVLILVISGGLAIYFTMNKPKIVAELNNQITQNISGTMHIGDVNCKFLSGFPNLTLALNKVELKDSLWSIHKRTLLKSKEIEVQISLIGIFRKKFNIRKIAISDATIDLYKDKNGISNSNIFRPKPKVVDNKKPAEIKIQKIELEKVVFISENQQRNKLFHFEVNSLKGKMKYYDDSVKINLKLETLAKSMAFNTKKGSFIKDKILKGELLVDFSKSKHKINVVTKNLKIGEDAFDISAYFNVAKGNSLFGIDIKTNILWSNAYHLLADNISSKLNKFDMTKPLIARCVIKGDLNSVGDPEIVVTAKINSNQLSIPFGQIQDCNFNAKFTNNFIDGNGCEDANSAIIVDHLSGKFKNYSFLIPKASIFNIEKPIIKGNGSVAISGGTVAFEGKLIPTNNLNQIESKVTISKIDVSNFLTTFDNFGIKSFSPKSIRGVLSLDVSFSGDLTKKGDLIKNSVLGHVDFNVVNGALINFQPLMNIGKYAKKRDFNNITFSELKSNFKLRGTKIDVNGLKISSSVLALQANGVYSFNGGTNLYVDLLNSTI